MSQVFGTLDDPSGGRQHDQTDQLPSNQHPPGESSNDPSPSGSSGVRQFICPTCSKTFGRRDYLERHVLNHQKPSAICTQCGKAFARADVLRKHLATSCPASKGRIVETAPSQGHESTGSRQKRRKSSPNGSFVSTKTDRTDRTAHTAHKSIDWTGGLANGLGLIGENQVPMYPPMAHSYTLSRPPSMIGEQAVPFAQPVVNPDLIGENMGDLLQWLFQPPIDGNQTLVNDSILGGGLGPKTDPDTMGATTPLASVPQSAQAFSLAHTPTHPTDPSSQSPHAGNTAPLPVSLVTPFPPVQTSTTREPQAIHPYTHPNKWKPGLFPPFVEEGPRGPPPIAMELLSERMRLEMLSLFEATDDEKLMLSTTNMRYYLDLYFAHFGSLYPLIHQASLPYRALAPDLILAMVSIGIAYASDPIALNTACRAARRLRQRIFLLLEEEPRAPVSVLQTALLINHFSRSFGDFRQHDAAQIFHPPVIIACRLSGVFLPKFTPPATNGTQDPMAYWLEWVEEEERKRVGYFAFIMDTESVALFKQSSQVQCVSLQTEQPLGIGPWLAKDPYEWNHQLRTYPLPLSFRTSLRHIISLGFIPPNLDDSHLWLVLHGMLSASCSLLWRDLGDLSMMQDAQLTQWKAAMRGAFDTWRNYVLALHTSNVPGPDGISTNHSTLRRIGIPFCLMGCIVLLTDTEQIRIFAGATSASGRPVAPGEWTAASAYVETWARSQDGAYACHYAALLLDEVYKSDWTFSPTIIPWCAYIASLVIWAYATSLDGCESLHEPFVHFIPRSTPSSHGPATAMLYTINGQPAMTSNSTTDVQIEPIAASRAADQYLSTILACPHPFSLPDIPKSRCGGVIAYTTHLVGVLGRGMLVESYRVLTLLLRDSQVST